MAGLFLDANVLFSACYRPESGPALIFELARVCNVSLFATSFVVDEARRNLALKAPAAVARLDLLAGQLTPVGAPTNDEVGLALVHGVPEKDAPVLAAAIRSSAAMLVTGDRRHFGRFFGRSVGGVQVVTVAAALESMLRGDRSSP